MGEFYFRRNRDGWAAFAAQVQSALAFIPPPQYERLQTMLASEQASVNLGNDDARGLASLLRSVMNDARAASPSTPIAFPLDGNHTNLYFDRDGNVTEGAFRDNDDQEFGEPAGGATQMHQPQPQPEPSLEAALAKLVVGQDLSPQEVVMVIRATCCGDRHCC